MRALRVLLVAASVLLVAAIAAAWLLPGWLDPARVRAVLEQAASERLGATVTIDGPVGFALLPRPVLRAGRVSLLHGAPGDADGLAVTAEQLTARLDLAALLRGRLTAAELELDGAEVQAPFPFDIRVLTAGRPAGLGTTAISLRRSRLRLGPLLVEQMQGRLAVDPLTGDAVLSGMFRLPGGSAWRAGLRLSRPGGDGSAALDATLDEIYAAEGPTAALTGQLAGDGGFAGRLSLSGPNLARIMPAPAIPFAATGRVSVAGGIAAFDDVALTLDAVACQLDASLHLPPQPRLDLRLSAGRLDLDAWRRALAATAPPSLPIGLDLAADSAGLRGATLRQLRAGLALDGPHLAVRDLQAGLPGGMALQADGAVELAAGTSRMEVRLDGSDLRPMAAWLGGMADLQAAAALPEGMFRALGLRATVETSGTELEAHDISATLDGVGLRGDAILSWPTTRPSVAAILSVDRLDLAPLLPGWDTGVPVWPWPGLDGAIQLATPRVLIPGMDPASLDLDVATRGGALDVHHLRLTAPSWRLDGHFARSTEGRWSDAALELQARRAADLLALLPAGWRERAALWPVLTAEPLHASLLGAGTAAQPSASLAADLGLLHVEASAEAAAGAIRGSLRLRHPNAGGLAARLGVPAAFLGDGSLSVLADASLRDGILQTDQWHLRAGLLDAGGRLRLDLSGPEPSLSGGIEAAVLRLPGVDWHSAATLPLAVLGGWRASLDVTAARAETPQTTLTDLHGHVSLADNRVEVADLAASLQGGGTVAGTLALDAAVQPPRGSAELSLAGVRLAAQPWHPLGLLARDVSADLRLRAQGYAPAAMLATLGGELRATSGSASVVGMDVGSLGGDLSDAAVRAALSGGRTLLDTATASLSIEHGLATVDGQASAFGGARLAATGAIDLPAATVDLDLSIIPAITTPPRIGLRLSGEAAHATAVPELGELARWRAAQN